MRLRARRGRYPDWWFGGGSNKCGRSSKLTFWRCNCTVFEGCIEHPASETSFNHSSFRGRCLGRGRVRGIMHLCSSQLRLLCIIGRGKTVRLLRLAAVCHEPTTNHTLYLIALTAIQTRNHNSTCFAFARDNGLPFAQWIGKVHPTMHIPANAVALTCLLSLINIGFFVLIWHRQKKLQNQSSLWSFPIDSTLSLFDRKIYCPAYEALFIPLLSPTFFPLAGFARIYTTLFYEQNGMRTAISVALCHMQNIIIGLLVVPGLLQPEGDGRLLAFQYPIVSQDGVAPTSKVHPPRLTMISYIPLASRSTYSDLPASKSLPSLLHIRNVWSRCVVRDITIFIARRP